MTATRTNTMVMCAYSECGCHGASVIYTPGTEATYASAHPPSSAPYPDPTLGRWTQPDPQRRLLDLQQGNLYPYAGDKPSNNVDPSYLLFGSVLKVLVRLTWGLDTLGLAALPAYAGFVIGGIAAPIVGIFAGLAILAPGGGLVLYEVISNGA